MPLITCGILENVDHIFHPIVKQVAHRLVDSLNLTSIIGDGIYIDSDWSTHSKTSSLSKDAIVNADQFRVDVSVQLNPTSQKWDCYTFAHSCAHDLTLNNINDRVPIFYDKNNSVRIIEMQTPVTFQLNCKISLQEAELAYTVANQLYAKYENGTVVHMNDLIYDYPLPKEILTILLKIWNMDRISGKDSGNSFYNYLKKNSNGVLELNTNRNIKNEYEVLVSKVNLQTLGALEFSNDKPDVEKAEKLSLVYDIPFTYTIQFGMPNISLMHYPCLINNQLLPAEFIPRDNHSRFNRMPEGREYKSLEHRDQLIKDYDEDYLRVPVYDDWIVPDEANVSNRELSPFLIMAVMVDENEDLYTEVDLADDSDPNCIFPPVLKEILYQEGEEALDTDAIVVIQLYRKDKRLVPKKDFNFSDNLVVTFNALNLHDQYHVVLSTNSINHINAKWLWLLAKYFTLLPGRLKYEFKNFFNTELSSINKNGIYRLNDDGWIYQKQSSNNSSGYMDSEWTPSKPIADSEVVDVLHDRANDLDGDLKYGTNTCARIIYNTIRTKRT